MKKRILIIPLLFCFFLLNAQNKTNIYNEDSLVWFGLNFSKTKLIGTSENFKDLHMISTYYFAEWNSLFLKESDKYNLKTNYNKKFILHRINFSVKQSLTNDTNTILTLDYYKIERDSIDLIINKYPNLNEGKIGLVYIVETLDKLNGIVTVWVVFFDIKTKKVLIAKRVKGELGGFGFRNYYARGFYNVLIYSGKKLKKWTKEVNQL